MHVHTHAHTCMHTRMRHCLVPLPGCSRWLATVGGGAPVLLPAWEASRRGPLQTSEVRVIHIYPVSLVYNLGIHAHTCNVMHVCIAIFVWILWLALCSSLTVDYADFQGFDNCLCCISAIDHWLCAYFAHLHRKVCTEFTPLLMHGSRCAVATVTVVDIGVTSSWDEFMISSSLQVAGWVMTQKWCKSLQRTSSEKSSKGHPHCIPSLASFPGSFNLTFQRHAWEWGYALTVCS